MLDASFLNSKSTIQCWPWNIPLLLVSCRNTTQSEKLPGLSLFPLKTPDWNFAHMSKTVEEGKQIKNTIGKVRFLTS
jgi:hypothetical protein